LDEAFDNPGQLLKDQLVNYFIGVGVNVAVVFGGSVGVTVKVGAKVAVAVDVESQVGAGTGV
jgi:hypothetical protein